MTTERFVVKITLAIFVFLCFGIIANWMTRIQEQKNEEIMRKSEMRIGQIRDECSRRIEDQEIVWKKDLEKKVEAKVQDELSRSEKKCENESRDVMGQRNTDLKKLKDEYLVVVKERDHLKRLLSDVTDSFHVYKEKFQSQDIHDKKS